MPTKSPAADVASSTSGARPSRRGAATTVAHPAGGPSTTAAAASTIAAGSQSGSAVTRPASAAVMRSGRADAGSASRGCRAALHLRSLPRCAALLDASPALRHGEDWSCSRLSSRHGAPRSRTRSDDKRGRRSCRIGLGDRQCHGRGGPVLSACRTPGHMTTAARLVAPPRVRDRSGSPDCDPTGAATVSRVTISAALRVPRQPEGPAQIAGVGSTSTAHPPAYGFDEQLVPGGRLRRTGVPARWSTTPDSRERGSARCRGSTCSSWCADRFRRSIALDREEPAATARAASVQSRLRTPLLATALLVRPALEYFDCRQKQARAGSYSSLLTDQI